jgi:hypothetical protein
LLLKPLSRARSRARFGLKLARRADDSSTSRLSPTGERRSNEDGGEDDVPDRRQQLLPD